MQQIVFFVLRILKGLELDKSLIQYSIFSNLQYTIFSMFLEQVCFKGMLEWLYWLLMDYPIKELQQAYDEWATLHLPKVFILILGMEISKYMQKHKDACLECSKFREKRRGRACQE